MEQPLEVRGDGGRRLVIQVFHLSKRRDGLFWAEHCHRHHQGHVLALGRAQRDPRPVAERFLPQDGLYRRREGAFRNGIGHDNLVPFYLFNPQTKPRNGEPQSMHEVRSHNRQHSSPSKFVTRSLYFPLSPVER